MLFRKIGLFTVILSCLFVLFSCDAKETAAKMPDSIKVALENVPEDVFFGIGHAKTESDGEAILLAEDYAREDIARQLLTMGNAKFTDSVQANTSTQEDFSESRTITRINDSRVTMREKDKSGTWWCVVISLPESRPAKSDSNNLVDILRSNSAEWPGIAEVRTSNAIPDWVLGSRDQPEDMAWGIGAAKLVNDKESMYLARERARRSLTRSLTAEFTSVIYDYNYLKSYKEFNTESFKEESFNELHGSITSPYDYTALQTQLVNWAKTKDGTWWVLLGCPVK